MPNEQTNKLFWKLFMVLTSSLYYRVNLFCDEWNPFAWYYFWMVRFVFHGIFKTISMIYCRWQQQLFSLKVGASGALFGLIGLLIVKLLQLRHDVRRPCCEVLCLLGVALISFGKYNNLQIQSLWIIPSSEKSLLKSTLLYTDFLALSVDHSFSLVLSLSTA